MSSSLVGASGGGGGSGGMGGNGGGAGGSGCGGGGGGGGPCGACKFLRRKCVHGCIFAPYFDAEQGAAHFAAVHKVFGASNVSKMLQQIPAHRRLDAVVTTCYEAQARIRDPVYGCVSHIFSLQQQVVNLQTELSYLQAHLSTMEQPTPQPFAAQPQMPMNAGFSGANLPSSSNIPANVDMSSLFDPQAQSQWAIQQQYQLQQQQQHHQQQYVRMGGEGSSRDAGNVTTVDSDLQALLARELLDGHGGMVGSNPQLPPPPPPQPRRRQ